MTSIHPVFIYELLKQKIDWGTKLTPVTRDSDFVETFNTGDNTNLIINGQGIARNGIPVCKNGGTTGKGTTGNGNKLTNLKLGDNIRTVIVNLTNVCLTNSNELQVETDLYGYNQKITDLLSERGETVLDLLNDVFLNKAIKKDKKYTSINLGNKTPDPNKKDVLGLLLTLLQSEYNKVDQKSKDGNLKQNILNEVGLLISDGQKYLEVLDATQLSEDLNLCNASDSNVNNTMTITNINKYSMLDEGKTFCVDVDIQTYFTQSRIQTINTKDTSKMNQTIAPNKQMVDNNRKEMMDSGKASVLESYVAGLLDQIYKDKDKYNVDILRPSDNIIFLKVTDKQSKEIFFNKIDITNAISDSGSCGEEKINSRIREFITVQKFCKGNNFYKVQFLMNGSDHTKIFSRKIPFAKLQEAKDQKAFADYIQSLHLFIKKESIKSTPSVVKPKSALVILNSPYNYYGGVYGGLYGLGLPGAGLYSYPRLGYGGIYGSPYGYGGIYGYPYGYGGVYSSPYVYTPPLVGSIIPTAPFITSPVLSSPVLSSPVVSSPVVSSPIYSSVAPMTYSYPMVTTSNYTLGSYYSPYANYGYSYASPFQYTYTTPYTYVKSEEKRIRLDKEDVIPTQASTYNELVEQLKDYQQNVQIEKVGNMIIKVDVEKNFIKETHYYNYDNGKIYLTEEHDFKVAI
jgi:hypothetical protein